MNDIAALVAWLRATLYEIEAVAYGTDSRYWGHLVAGQMEAQLKIVGKCADILDLEDCGHAQTGDVLAWDVLRLVASAYADRPGYREEWRPA